MSNLNNDFIDILKDTKVREIDYKYTNPNDQKLDNLIANIYKYYVQIIDSFLTNKNYYFLNFHFANYFKLKFIIEDQEIKIKLFDSNIVENYIWAYNIGSDFEDNVELVREYFKKPVVEVYEENGRVYKDLDPLVKEIGEEAFAWCSALTSITIPDSVEEIGFMAFNNCSSLTEVSIPNSVTDIGNGAFGYCPKLKSITLPESLNSIGMNVLYDCTNLKEIILLHADPTQICVPEEEGLGAEQATLYVPKESVIAYQEHWFWSEFAAIKPITDEMLK